MQRERIYSIDLMRALAVILMVEGHTVHVFLNSGLRDATDFFYSAWVWLRGFTAPLFMFVSGLIFTYLLFDDELKIKPYRVKKGISRGIFLISLGYLLRFPTLNPFRAGNITERQVLTFISVDALHIIGLGIISIALFNNFFTRIRAGKLLLPLNILSAVIIFISGYFIANSDLFRALPKFLSSYFIYDYGSVFTLFPWLGYLFAGASVAFSIKLKLFDKHKVVPLLFSSALFSIALFHSLIYGENYFTVIIERLFFTVTVFLILNTFAGKNIRQFNAVKIIGRNALLIYIVHLVILYGSPLTLGFWQLFPQSLSLAQTILAVLLMETIMFYIATLKEKNSYKIMFNGIKKIYAKVS